MRKTTMWLLLAIASAVISSCSGKESGENTDSAVIAARSREGADASGQETNYRIENNVIIPVGRPAVVDFYADWCPPCREYMPVVEKVESDFDGLVTFIRINVDENEQLARRYVGRGIPTTAFILPGGSVMGSVEGMISEEMLTDYVNQLVAAAGQTEPGAL